MHSVKPSSISIDPEMADAAPTPRQLAYLAGKWFKDIQEFRAWENEHLFGEAPGKPLQLASRQPGRIASDAPLGPAKREVHDAALP